MARMGMALSIRAIRAIGGLISTMLVRLPSCGCGSAAQVIRAIRGGQLTLLSRRSPRRRLLGEERAEPLLALLAEARLGAGPRRFFDRHGLARESAQ